MVELTHPRCDDPTCFVPAKHCQGDHIVPWSQGGATSQGNGRSACGFHNRLWYLHPHLAPPPRQPIPTGPPGTDGPHRRDEPGRNPAHDPTDEPGRDPAHDPPDEPGRDPAHHPTDEPARDDPRTAPDTIDHRTGQALHRCRTRPRPPDLIVTIDDTIYEITLNA